MAGEVQLFATKKAKQLPRLAKSPFEPGTANEQPTERRVHCCGAARVDAFVVATRLIGGALFDDRSIAVHDRPQVARAGETRARFGRIVAGVGNLERSLADAPRGAIGAASEPPGRSHENQCERDLRMTLSSSLQAANAGNHGIHRSLGHSNVMGAGST